MVLTGGKFIGGAKSIESDARICAGNRRPVSTIALS
jgi:hypothetical protein